MKERGKNTTKEGKTGEERQREPWCMEGDNREMQNKRRISGSTRMGNQGRGSGGQGGDRGNK